MNLSFRPATADDAKALSELAARTFEETFAHSTSAANMADYLSEAYSIAVQLGEITNPDITTLLGEIDGSLAAFTQVRSGDTPGCVTTREPIELWRFYVSREWHGRGIAHDMMRAVESVAANRGAQSIWLGVWEHNHRAQAFYRKYGFADAGSQVYMVGTDAQTDRIFVRTI